MDRLYKFLVRTISIYDNKREIFYRSIYARNFDEAWKIAIGKYQVFYSSSLAEISVVVDSIYLDINNIKSIKDIKILLGGEKNV